MTNTMLIQHVERLCANYLRVTGEELLAPATDGLDMVCRLDEAPFAVVSHGTGEDPVFNYGNRRALRLFEMSWDEFTALPSRCSAEASAQAERASLLEQVSKQGYIDNYTGVRISRSGRRFLIKQARIWNLFDAGGQYCGQAALIRDWEDVPSASQKG